MRKVGLLQPALHTVDFVERLDVYFQVAGRGRSMAFTRVLSAAKHPPAFLPLRRLAPMKIRPPVL